MQNLGTGMRFGYGAVERSFQESGQTIHCRRFGTPSARRRHHSTPELPNDLFPRFGMLGDVLQIEVLKRQSGHLGIGIVAAEAVLFEERAMGRDRPGRLLAGVKDLSAGKGQDPKQGCAKKEQNPRSHEKPHLQTRTLKWFSLTVHKLESNVFEPWIEVKR